MGSAPKDVNEVLSLVFDDAANFKPDGRYQYSNTNYLLIGNILDKTLGYSHQQYIKKEILDRVVIQFVNTSGGDSWGKSEIIYKRLINILRKKS